MTQNHYDVVINGMGIVGLTLALALSRAQFKVAIIDKTLPIVSDFSNLDARVSALNPASIQIFKNLNIWQQLPSNQYVYFSQLKVWDECGGGEIEFNSAEIGLPALGAIAANQAVTQALLKALDQENQITRFCPAQPTALTQSDEVIVLHFAEGNTLSAKLLIGADGLHSWVRQQLGTPIKNYAYHQIALIAVIQTEYSHEHTGWQVFTKDGSLALLPLADEHRCAIVWSTHSKRAESLLALKPAVFTRELNNEFGIRLGRLSVLTDLQSFPLNMQRAENIVGSRMTLVGDAAMRIHPLAGQGANIGLRDANCLTELLIEAREKKRDLGDARTLRAYQRSRKLEHRLMGCLMTGFKEIFTLDVLGVMQMRNYGLNTLNRNLALKNIIMRRMTRAIQV